MKYRRSFEHDSRMWKAVAAAVTLLAFARGCHCKSIYNVGIGDDSTWDFPPYSNFYQDWADGLELSDGDTLCENARRTRRLSDNVPDTWVQRQWRVGSDYQHQCQNNKDILFYEPIWKWARLRVRNEVQPVPGPSKTKRGVKLGLSVVSPIDSSESLIESPTGSPSPAPGEGTLPPPPPAVSPPPPAVLPPPPAVSPPPPAVWPPSSAVWPPWPAVLPPSPPLPSTPGAGKGSTVAVIVPIVVVVLLLVFGGLIIYKCRRHGKPTSISHDTQPNGPGGETEHKPDKKREKEIVKEQNRIKCKQFTLKELKIATGNFSEDNKLGEGGFGTVYKGVLRGGRMVAVKRAKAERSTDVEQFMNEVSILSQLNHCNLVELLGCCMEHKVPILVFEFISNGTLKEHLSMFRGGYSTELNWQCRFNIALQTAEALKYLHSQARPPIIHRDVKGCNILLDNDFGAKVADFGISKLVDVGSTHVSTAIKGTPGYLDPEYSLNGQLTDKSDVYSYGIVLLELITSNKPIDDDAVNLAHKSVPLIKMKRAREIIDTRLVKEFSEKDFRTVENVAEVAVECLEKERASRPTMSEIVEMLQRIKGSKLKVDAFSRRIDIANSGPREPNSVAILRPFNAAVALFLRNHAIKESDI